MTSGPVYGHVQRLFHAPAATRRASEYLEALFNDSERRSTVAIHGRLGDAASYQAFHRFITHAGTKDALQFLLSREITHMKAFTAAPEGMGNPHVSNGKIPPTPGC